jgi:co-chaperonin GroES (HSP10)
MNNGGDVLARGGQSAQFAGAGAKISQFEDDLVFRSNIVAEKYGITEEEITGWKIARDNGEVIPDLPTAESKKDKELFTVTDRRLFLNEERVKPVELKKNLKFPEKDYSIPRTLLDRVLVKRVSADKNLQLLEDGSMKDLKTGFIIPAKYRQHSNTGVVLLAGKFVVVGGQRIPMEEVLQPGDRVTYGDYNSEVFHMSEEKIIELCDAVGLNYEPDEEGLRVVRVQDIRIAEAPMEVK